MKLSGITRRQLARRPGRTALTVLGIAIGVAGFVAVHTTVDVARGAWADLFRSLAGDAPLEVVREGGGPFPRAALGALERDPRIAAATPAVQGPAALLAGKRAPVMVLGLEEGHLAERSGLVLRDGARLPGRGEALLEAGFARAAGLEDGSALRVLGPGGIVTLRLVGLLEPRGAAARNGGAVVFMRLEDAQRVLALGAGINTLRLQPGPGLAVQDAQRELAAMLPTGFVLQEPSRRDALGRQTLATTEQVLSLISVFSLVAGAFVALNTFLMSLSERRRQFAILRALGTTRRQLTSLLLREALLFGTLGGIAGCVLGALASGGTTLALEEMLNLDLPAFTLDAGTLTLGFLLGPLAALLACVIPSRNAGRRPPLLDLAGRGTVEAELPARALAIAGTVSVGLSLVLLAAFMSGLVPHERMPELMGPGATLFMVGFILLMPSCVRPLGRLVHRLLRPLQGVEGLLAARQVDRHRSRASLTIGVLFISVTVTVGLGNATLSSAEDIMEWYDHTIAEDYFIRGVLPDGATLTSARIPDDLLEQVRRVPGVAAVSPLRFIPATVGGRQAVIVTKPYRQGTRLPLEVVEGEPDDVLGGLRAGQVALGSVLAHRLGVHPGETVTLGTPSGPRELTVCGVFTAYTAGGAAAVLHWDVAAGFFPQSGADAYLVRAARPEPPGLAAALERLCDERGLMFQTRAELTAYFERLVRNVDGLLWALLVVMFLVASMGTVNSVSMNVLDQVREIGVLRAVALERSRLVRMVLHQGLLMAVIGALPGLLVGTGLAWIFNVATQPMTGYRIPFQLHPSAFLVALVLLITMTLMACLIPARRAGRLPIIQALRHS